MAMSAARLGEPELEMMAAGWDGAPVRNAPGFPDDGTGTVRWEGLRPAL